MSSSGSEGHRIKISGAPMFRPAVCAVTMEMFKSWLIGPRWIEASRMPWSGTRYLW